MDFNCIICETPIKLKPFHVKRFKGPFCCSRKCRGEFIKTEYSGQNNPNYKYRNEIQKYFAIRTSDIKRRSNKKQIPFNLNEQFLYELYNKQRGLCYYTNVPMKISTDNFTIKGQADLDVVSVDKINPDLGYIENNVVLCCSGINKLKGNSTIEELEYFLKNIANKYNENQC